MEHEQHFHGRVMKMEAWQRRSHNMAVYRTGGAKELRSHGTGGDSQKAFGRCDIVGMSRHERNDSTGICCLYRCVDRRSPQDHTLEAESFRGGGDLLHATFAHTGTFLARWKSHFSSSSHA